LKNYAKTIFLLTAMILIIIISTGCQKKTAYDTFESYGDKWRKKDYEGMYTMLSSNAKETINKDEVLVSILKSNIKYCK